MRSEHKFLCMLGQLALWKYGRGYALYERGELIAVFMYRKGALRVAELFAQAWPGNRLKTTPVHPGRAAEAREDRSPASPNARMETT
jgi:hypothetical protein